MTPHKIGVRTRVEWSAFFSGLYWEDGARFAPGENFAALLNAAFSAEERLAQAEESRATNARLLDELYPRLHAAEARVQQLEAALDRACKFLERSVNHGFNTSCAIDEATYLGAALTTQGEEGKRCVRCGSPYRPDGGCADTPCQGGVGEWAPPEKPEPPKLALGHAYQNGGCGDYCEYRRPNSYDGAPSGAFCARPRAAHETLDVATTTGA